MSATKTGKPARGVLVSIAGPSCSGKTTVSTEVARRLGAVLLHLDRHWVDSAARPEVNGYPSREQPHQYNGAALMHEAQILLDEGRTVVAEGFLMLCYPEVVARTDHAFLVTAPHSVLAARRAARSAAGGNVVWVNQGVAESRVDTGWHVHGREEWERWGAPQARMPGVIVLDGTKPSGELVDSIVERIRSTA